MYEFKYTFEDVKSLTPAQMRFLIEVLNKKYKEEEKAIKRARRR